MGHKHHTLPQKAKRSSLKIGSEDCQEPEMMVNFEETMFSGHNQAARHISSQELRHHAVSQQDLPLSDTMCNIGEE